MTFSIIGRCEETGAFGAAITTSDLAVGGRCIRLSHGRGAMLSQHRTDSRLGDLGIELLRNGASADEAVAEVCASTQDIEWRQVGALDAQGHAAVYHGRMMYSIYSHAVGKNCLALGNILSSPDVTAKMATAFADAQGVPLGERLMLALEAGEAAGGEILGPLRSAALVVTGEHRINTYDLRVDLSTGSAVSDLRTLFEAYKGRDKPLRKVALYPDTVPVQRALFDASISRIDELGLSARFPTASHREHWDVAD